MLNIEQLTLLCQNAKIGERNCMNHTASTEFNASPQNSHVKYDLTPEVEAIGKMELPDVVLTPQSWYLNIRNESGAADLISIVLLSDIFYWYRPSYKRSESSGALIAVKKKFKADALQRSKASYAAQFGFTERQVKDSLARLEKLGLIKRDYRTVKVGDMVLSNVLFIIIFPKKIEEITFGIPAPSPQKTEGGYDVQTSYPPPSDVKTSEGDTKIRQPHIYNTKTTTEITKQQQQENVVVVSEKKAAVFTKDDAFFGANKFKKDWTVDEIEDAFKAFKLSKANITDPLNYIEGIIKKQRILNKSKESPCKIIEPEQNLKKTPSQSTILKKSSAIDKPPLLANDTEVLPLPTLSLMDMIRRSVTS